MSGFFIGIDVGGTNLKAGLTNETGRLLAAARRPLDFRGAETFAADLADLAAEVLSTAGAVPGDAEGVGIGLPGAVSGGEVLYTTNIPLERTDLAALFRRRLDLPVLLGNDADCAAGRNVPIDDAAGADDAVVTDGHARQDDTVSADPNVAAHSNRIGIFEPLVALLIVDRVTGGIKSAVGSDEYIVAEGDFRSVEDDTVVVDIEVVARLDVIAIVTPERLLYPWIASCFGDDFPQQFLPLAGLGRSELVVGKTQILADQPIMAEGLIVVCII